MTEPISLEEVVSLLVEQPAEFLGTLKTESGEWKAKDEIKKSLNDAYSNRLKKVVEEQKGRAVRERMSATEKFLREKYNIESGDTLESRIEKLVETIEAKGGKEKIVEKQVEITEETALKHPIFQNLLKKQVIERATELEKERDEWKSKYSDYITKAEREKLDSAVFGEASSILNGIKAALDKDPEKRERQVKMFIAGLKSGYSFKLDENGKPYPVNGNGEPLEDPTTYARITFADLVKRENIFGVHNFDPDQSSPGATSQTTGTTQRSNVTVPNDLAAFNEAIKLEKDPQKRKAMFEAFDAKQKAAGK